MTIFRPCHTAESRLSREGQAKKIYYVWGTAKSSQLQEYIDNSSEGGKAIALSIDAVNSAFKTAVERFNKVLSKNTSLSKLVSERADKFFINIPSEVAGNQKLK